MKTTSSLKILFSFGLLSSSYAIDQPKSNVRGGAKDEEVERHLAMSYNAASSCQRKLSACQAKTGGVTAALLVEQLDKLAMNDASGGVADLRAALISAEGANFEGLGGDVMRSDMDYGMLIDLGSKVTHAAVEDSAAYRYTLQVIEAAVNTILKTVGVFSDVDFTPITEMVSGLENIASRIPNDDLLLMALTQTAVYVGKMIVYFSGLLVARESSDRMEVAACTEQAMVCEFNSMVMDVGAAAVAGLFLADAMESAGPVQVNLEAP